MDDAALPGRILLQTGPEDTIDLVAQLATALRGIGVEVDYTDTLAPDLAPYDLIHVFDTSRPATGLAAARQVLRARSWGLPVILSPTGGTLPSPDHRTAERHLRALGELAFGAADLVLLGPAGEGTTTTSAAQPREVTSHLRLPVRTRPVHFAPGDPPSVPTSDDDWRRAAEETRLGYEDAGRIWRARLKDWTERTGAMAVTEQPGDDEADRAARPPWLPDLPPHEYIAHLEGLIQLQLEAIALRDARHADFRDAQYAQLLANHRGLEESYHTLVPEYRALEEGFHARGEHVRSLETGLEAERRERARVEEAYRTLEANAREQGDYVARLEAALAEASRSPLARLFGGHGR